MAYLHLPEIPEKNYQKSEGRRCTIEALQQAKAVGADVINMVFQRGSDIDLIWDDLTGEMQATDGHPGFEFRRLNQMLTIFSANCGEPIWEDLFEEYEFATGVPTICLTFSGPSDFGNMVVQHVQQSVWWFVGVWMAMFVYELCMSGIRCDICVSEL